MKTTKQNTEGFAHVIALGAFVAAFAVAGGTYLVISHADTVQVQAQIDPASQPAPDQIQPDVAAVADPPKTSDAILRAHIDTVLYGQKNLGIHEVPLGSNHLPGNPYGSNNLSWCAYFASWVWQQAGVRDKQNHTFPRYVNANQIKSWGSANGRWHPIGSYTPRVGDAVYFQYGVHVGVVATSGSGLISIIAGNYKDSVTFQTSQRGKYTDKPSTFAVQETAGGPLDYVAGFVSPD